MELGWMLYIVLAVLLFFTFPHFRGKSLEDLFAASHARHHQVHAVAAKHAHGGTWAQHRAWMEEAARAHDV